MNSLSWLIYWIGVVDTAHLTVGIMTVVATIVVLILSGAVIVAAGESAYKSSFKERYVEINSIWKNTKIFLWGVVCMGLIIQIFMPSRQTLLLIAGSEIGQKVVSSQAVQDVVNPGMDLLKAWISEETAKLKESATGNGKK